MSWIRKTPSTNVAWARYCLLIRKYQIPFSFGSLSFKDEFENLPANRKSLAFLYWERSLLSDKYGISFGSMRTESIRIDITKDLRIRNSLASSLRRTRSFPSRTTIQTERTLRPIAVHRIIPPFFEGPHTFPCWEWRSWVCSRRTRIFLAKILFQRKSPSFCEARSPKCTVRIAYHKNDTKYVHLLYTLMQKDKKTVHERNISEDKRQTKENSMKETIGIESFANNHRIAPKHVHPHFLINCFRHDRLNDLNL